MKNMGVAGPDSSKETAKSSDLPITYLLPSFSSTKSLRGEYESVLLLHFFFFFFIIIFDRQAEIVGEWEVSLAVVQYGDSGAERNILA